MERFSLHNELNFAHFLPNFCRSSLLPYKEVSGRKHSQHTAKLSVSCLCCMVGIHEYYMTVIMENTYLEYITKSY